MAKEEPKKEKKSKRKAAAAANGAAAAAAPAPANSARAAVVASVAAFLESAGLPRTLAALQSEAGLEAATWGSSQVNLEELVAKFLESSNSTPVAAVLGSNEQDKENGDTAGEVSKKKKRSGTEAGEPEIKVSEPSAHEKPSENIGHEAKEKKQKKKKDKGDPSAANAASSEATETVKNDDQKLDVDGEAKEKKQKKDKGDPSAVDAVTGEATETVKNDGQKFDVDGEAKEKKQKKKKKDKSDPSAADAVSDEATETVKNDDQKIDGKKKSKKQGKDDDVEARLEKAESAIINKFEAAERVNGDGNESREEKPKSQNDGADESSGAVEKKKKKKKEKSAVETSEKTNAGSAPAEADGAKGKNGVVETAKDDNEKKAKKKRKKSNPEENVQVEVKEAAGKDPVLKPDDANKSGMDVDEDRQGKSSNENAVAGKKRKLEDVEGSIVPVTPKEDSSTANQSLSNGFAEDKTNEDSNIKPSKRQKKSSEPKSVTPFQRIQVDSVTFADERLQDNSYWAKGGADTGYGAKAQEILGQVRGRGFRHEKTKKKRGTYRGGQIDLQTHSIKFENSDDE
ncbi:unnamed protein product [Miscanthus lutarioriparius]|uniref:Srp40 C-terminal domain-containing protein n=1 Tax=Miscanthus lutarioriparius TaxID=422564 RepID=A0A811RA81_9POAL|nr:unnamed protein product [Miscanthus lutarioriparius]